MKSKLFKIVIVMAVLFSSCSTPPMTKAIEEAQSQNAAFPIIKVRGCEYIYCDVDKGNSSYGNVALTHCGDCNNPVHKK